MFNLGALPPALALHSSTKCRPLAFRSADLDLHLKISYVSESHLQFGVCYQYTFFQEYQVKFRELVFTEESLMTCHCWQRCDIRFTTGIGISSLDLYASDSDDRSPTDKDGNQRHPDGASTAKYKHTQGSKFTL